MKNHIVIFYDHSNLHSLIYERSQQHEIFRKHIRLYETEERTSDHDEILWWVRPKTPEIDKPDSNDDIVLPGAISMRK
jgi:hypothetical protein